MRVYLLGLALVQVSNAFCVSSTERLADVKLMAKMPADTRCIFSLSSQIVDYGILTHGQLQQVRDGEFTPGVRSLMLGVLCPFSRAMKLRVQGAADAYGRLLYGVNGYTRLRLLDAQLDGHAVEMRLLTAAGIPYKTETTAAALTIITGQQAAPVVEGRIAQGKILTLRLEIQPVLPGSAAHVSQPQRSDSALRLILTDP